MSSKEATLLYRFPVSRGEAMGVGFAPDGKSIVTTGFDGVFRWDVREEGSCLAQYYDEKSVACRGPAISTNGKVMLAAVGFSTFIWDFKTDQLLHELQTSQGYATSVGVSKDGKVAITGKPDVVHIWKTATGEEITCESAKGSNTWLADMAPDGKHAVSGSMKTLVLYEVKTGKIQQIWKDIPAKLNAVRYMPDSRHVLLATADKNVHRWDTEAGAVVQTLSGHSKTVHCVGISKTGKFIGSGSGDRLVIVRDAETGDEVARTTKHDYSVNGVAITSNGKHLATIDVTDLYVWKL